MGSAQFVAGLAIVRAHNLPVCGSPVLDHSPGVQ